MEAFRRKTCPASRFQLHHNCIFRHFPDRKRNLNIHKTKCDMQVSLNINPNMRFYRQHNAYLIAVNFHFLKFQRKTGQIFFVNQEI